MERGSSSSSSSSSDSSMASSDQSLSINSDQTSPFVTSSVLSRTTSSSSSSAVGDYIGTESCFDVLSAEEENDVVSVSASVSETLSRFRYGGRRREEREARAAAAREFPPPIPLLAQTENLHPHMPWVLKRVVTSDGRLILREEKVRHHEYFRAHRSNGRLTLHLVPLDDDVFELPQVPSSYQSDDEGDDDHDDEGHEFDDHDDHEVGDDDLDDLVDNVNKGVIVTAPNDNDKGNVHGDSENGYRKVILAAVAEETTVVESSGVVVGGGGGGGGSPRGKCLKSCFVGIRVREIRPVLS